MWLHWENLETILRVYVGLFVSWVSSMLGDSERSILDGDSKVQDELTKL